MLQRNVSRQAINDKARAAWEDLFEAALAGLSVPERAGYEER
jgi:hypothetical protein